MSALLRWYYRPRLVRLPVAYGRHRRGELLAAQRQSAVPRFRVGEPFLFKLHSPENYIVGGGFFSHFTILPARFVWKAFGQKNGAATEEEMRARIARYRRVASLSAADTPAMAAGISDHVWSMEDIAMLTDAAYAPKKRGPYHKKAANA